MGTGRASQHLLKSPARLGKFLRQVRKILPIFPEKWKSWKIEISHSHPWLYIIFTYYISVFERICFDKVLIFGQKSSLGSRVGVQWECFGVHFQEDLVVGGFVSKQNGYFKFFHLVVALHASSAGISIAKLGTESF